MAERRELLLMDNRGIYIPQHFAEGFDMGQWGVGEEDAAILLAGPDHEGYWETWDRVLDGARFTDSDGVEWHVEQDGDLWSVVYGEDDDEDEHIDG